MFAKEPMALGRGLRESMKVSRLEALRRAGQIRDGRAPSNDERAKLVWYLMAAYDYSSAMLQWSYLPAEFRASTPLVPDEVKAWLEKTARLEQRARNGRDSAGATPGPPVARAGRQPPERGEAPRSRRGSDGRTVRPSAPEGGLEGRGLQPLERGDRLRRRGRRLSSGLSPFQLIRVSRRRRRGAVGVVLEVAARLGPRPAAVRPVERRNIDIAARVVEQTASARAERVLLIIGSAHKPFVEEILGRLVHVRLVEFEKLAADRK